MNHPGRVHRSTLHARRGLALILVLATMFVVALIGVALLRAVVLQHRQVRREADRMQAGWLAESGVLRAAAALDRSVDYPGETWRVAADSRDASRSGLVVIGVKGVPDRPAERVIEVEARFPAAGETAVVQRRTMRLTILAEGDR
ncbi:MAG: hypothetical protein J5I93_30000 [Pirellulaceae bacterium]|nr:hypothetical protein [Pirellulaceae bacterium]